MIYFCCSTTNPLGPVVKNGKAYQGFHPYTCMYVYDIMHGHRLLMPINFQFDVRTIALFVAMTFFVQATVIGAQAYLIRELKQYRGVIAALLANICAAVGLMPRLFQAQLPIFLTTIRSNYLILTATAMYFL